MKFSGFIKLPKHRNFTYQPRYFDKELDDFEKEVKKKEGFSFSSKDSKAKIHHYFSVRRKEAKRHNTLRMLIIVATFVILAAALYLSFDLVLLLFKF